MARMGILGKGYSRTRAAARIKPIPHKKSKIARVVIPSGRSGLSNASELGAADFRRFACPDELDFNRAPSTAYVVRAPQAPNSRQKRGYDSHCR